MHRDTAILQDILRAGEAAERFLRGVDEATFERDELLRSAVAQLLLVVAEAAARLSSNARARAPQIRWDALAASRDFLVRPDSAIDWKLVWRTATRDLPDICRQAEKLLRGSAGLAG